MAAPIVLFTYNRLNHTVRTIEALLKNTLANESDLIVYSDAARTPDKKQPVEDVRSYLSTISGFHSVKIIHRPHNFGLANSIINGVTEVLQEYENVIVMEDDLMTSPYFLTYMNEALALYASDECVISIHGYVFPIKQELPEAFFLLGADCWGWATWRSGWACFNSDGQYLLDELKHRKLTDVFDYNNSYPFTKMLEDQVKGYNNSWAIRWHASAFLAGKLTLHPGRSLVYNIGHDDSGTHCSSSAVLDANLSNTKIILNNILIESSPECRQTFEDFFITLHVGVFKRLARKVTAFIKGSGV